MHLPDGFLDPRISIATAAVSTGAVAVALRRLPVDAEPSLVPRMGLTAAYVFAAQMVNFPVAAGTSGHLLGAVLAAVLVGPHAACVAMAAVFLIQTVFFLDGGHTALGANVLNMGLAGTYGGYAVFRTIAGPDPSQRRFLAAAGVAAWVAVMLGATLTAAQLALSGAIAGPLVFPAMLGVHAIIGACEAAITVGALALLWQVRPDLLTGRTDTRKAGARWIWGAVAGLALVGLLAPFASPSPDGLEHVAEQLGFGSRALDPRLPGPFPDYTLPGLAEVGWAPLLVSLLGAGLMVGALFVIGRLARGQDRGPALPGRLDARVKLAAMLGLTLSAVLMPVGQADKVALLALLAAAWMVASRVSWRWLLARGLVLAPFIGLAALSLPELRAGEGAAYGLIFLRAGTGLLASAAFVATTAEPEAVAALASFRLPRVICQTVAFALRYGRVLGEEARLMLQARAARSAGAGTLALRAGVTGGIVGSLFLRSYERAERVSLSMAARGYTPSASLGRQYAGSAQLRTADWLFAAGVALTLLGVWVWP